MKVKETSATIKAINNAATKVDHALAKHKVLRWAKHFHDIAMYSLIVVCLVTGGLYLKEHTVKIEDMVDVRAVIATDAEFQDGEPIDMYFIGKLNETSSDVSMHTVLRCDDGLSGSSFISSDEVDLNESNTISNPDTYNIISDYITSANQGQTYTQLSSTIRLITKTLTAGDEEPIQYGGSLPTGIATCFGEHTITAKTPIFGIDVVDRVQSYPFDYVWYGSIEESDE